MTGPVHPRREAHLLPLLLGLVVLLALIGAVLQLGDARRFAEIAREAQPAWLLLAILLQAATYTSEAGVWGLVLHRAGQRVPFHRLYALAIVALLTSQTVPSAGLAGALLVFQALRHWQVAVPVAMATILVELVGYYAAYGLYAGAGVLLLGLDGTLPPGGLVLGLAVVVLGIGMSAGSLWLAREHRRQPRPWRRLRRVGEAVAQLSSADHDLASHPPTLVAAVVLRGSNFALDALTLWACLFAVGVQAPLSASVAAFLSGSVVRTVGFVPGGLGTFEAATAASLAALGVDIEAALAAVLLYRGLSYWLPMPVGVALSRGLMLPPEVRA